jgi:hypothetical protein
MQKVYAMGQYKKANLVYDSCHPEPVEGKDTISISHGFDKLTMTTKFILTSL